jgi:hypothetical protein
VHLPRLRRAGLEDQNQREGGAERKAHRYRCVCVIELATLSFLPFLEAACELNRAPHAVCVPVALSQLEARESCVVAATLDATCPGVSTLDIS